MGKSYVDSRRIGIWGWVSRTGEIFRTSRAHTNMQSYGGFMTSKVMEADAGVHTLGMAVAVSDMNMIG